MNFDNKVVKALAVVLLILGGIVYFNYNTESEITYPSNESTYTSTSMIDMGMFKEMVQIVNKDSTFVTIKSISKFNWSYFSFSHIYVVSLGKELDDRDSIRPIIQLLQNAKPQDTVIFRLAGDGGQVETEWLLVNNIHTTKAHTIMVVEGPAYSAHAYIAVSGDALIMMPMSYLMFHTTSLYGVDCSKMTGTDRTVSMVEQCQSELDAHMYKNNQAIQSLWILTPEEKQLVLTGHQVFIMPEQYYERFPDAPKP